MQETAKAKAFDVNKVKVSRYPRANLPLELKSRFEINMGNDGSPSNEGKPKTERRGSIAS